MPQTLEYQVPRLEDICTASYLVHLFDEICLVKQLRKHSQSSGLLRHFGVNVDCLTQLLEDQFNNTVTGIVRDMVCQKLLNAVVLNLHKLCDVPHPQNLELTLPNENPFVCDRLDPTSNIPSQLALRQATGCMQRYSLNTDHYSDVPIPSTSHVNPCRQLSTCNIGVAPTDSAARHSVIKLLDSPLLKLFEVILHHDTPAIDLSKNKHWPENEALHEVARALWRVASQKCLRLKKLIIPKELSYSSTLRPLLFNGQNLTHLTLKRNVPNNMLLHTIGTNCHNLTELDIAGADVVTDFGIVCLLFSDPEHIFVECWNRDKTVGVSKRRNQLIFPHPYFDRPIPDPADDQHVTSGFTGPPQSQKSSRVQFLYLKRTFYDFVTCDSREWEISPISKSLKKLRLENTMVKGDGASMVLKFCPKVYSLGYLVFAAAGLKQVFGFETSHTTPILEIFYRGPSDQKLQTIANCCANLTTLFLGSNTVRRLNVEVFYKWRQLRYLTLENIDVEDVKSCLQVIGKQLSGLKLQCAMMEFSVVVDECPNLESLIFQRENPQFQKEAESNRNTRQQMSKLKHVEITGLHFPKSVFNFIMKRAPMLKSVKVMSIDNLSADDVLSWQGGLQELETFIIYRTGDSTNQAAVDAIFDVFGNLRGFPFIQKCANSLRRIQNQVKEAKWNLRLLESSSTFVSHGESQRDFHKLLSLHWFYLTEIPKQKLPKGLPCSKFSQS